MSLCETKIVYKQRSSYCEDMNVADLSDAYQTLRLASESQKYCGIMPIYWSLIYCYIRLSMGLSASLAIWKQFIDKVFENIPKQENTK